MAKGDRFGQLLVLPMAAPRGGKGRCSRRGAVPQEPPRARAAGLMSPAGLDDCAGRALATDRRPIYDATGRRHVPGSSPATVRDGRLAARPRPSLK
jgi:hypothetical protein